MQAIPLALKKANLLKTVQERYTWIVLQLQPKGKNAIFLLKNCA